MKPLTKSLHTVTAVSRLAKYLIDTATGPLGTPRAAMRALKILGYPHLPDADPTVLAAIEATRKLTS